MPLLKGEGIEILRIHRVGVLGTRASSRVGVVGVDTAVTSPGSGGAVGSGGAPSLPESGPLPLLLGVTAAAGGCIDRSDLMRAMEGVADADAALTLLRRLLLRLASARLSRLSLRSFAAPLDRTLSLPGGCVTLSSGTHRGRSVSPQGGCTGRTRGGVAEATPCSASMLSVLWIRAKGPSAGSGDPAARENEIPSVRSRS